MKKCITQQNVDQFLMLEPLLNAAYKEIQELSKKKSESPLNDYKVKIINRILVPSKVLMKNESIYDFLDVLDTDVLPTNSDVVLVLGQYKKAMDMYRNANGEYNHVTGSYEWNVKSETATKATRLK